MVPGIPDPRFSACDMPGSLPGTLAHLISLPGALQVVCRVEDENTEWTPVNGQAFPATSQDQS